MSIFEVIMLGPAFTFCRIEKDQKEMIDIESDPALRLLHEPEVHGDTLRLRDEL